MATVETHDGKQTTLLASTVAEWQRFKVKIMLVQK